MDQAGNTSLEKAVSAESSSCGLRRANSRNCDEREEQCKNQPPGKQSTKGPVGQPKPSVCASSL